MKKLISFLSSLAFVVGILLLANIAQASGVVFSRDLSYGTTGTAVSQLQQFLKDEGLFSGSVTATFGSITQSALISFQRQEGISATGYFGPLSRTDANKILNSHPDWVTTLSTNTSYSNVNGNTVHSPSYSSNGVPAGATARCKDGTYSFSLHHSGSCSHHGGVASWLQ
ncbi:MAG: DUF3761 domain-containing protein [Candidatus Staskawiczbacteria bacterium]|jgi:peptidoglycan hydrolase-like protein with peptidoglycan-binding domain